MSRCVSGNKPDIFDEMAAKQETAVSDGILTFISVKPLDIFRQTVGTISSHVCGDRTKPNIFSEP